MQQYNPHGQDVKMLYFAFYYETDFFDITH